MLCPCCTERGWSGDMDGMLKFECFSGKRGGIFEHLRGNDDLQRGIRVVGETRILVAIVDLGVRQSMSVLSENSPKKVKMPEGPVG